MKPIIPTRRILDDLPGRAVKFLRAAGTSRTIAAILATRGYSAAVHREGWRLVHNVSGFQEEAPPIVEEDPVVRDAILAIDAWDEPNFRIAHAALAMTFPEQDAALFAGNLAPTTGPGAVLTVKTFLDRLDGFEHGSKDDKAALARLALRGITKDERKRMRALLAQAASAVNVGPDDAAAPVAADDPTLDELVALYAWFSEWSEVARTVIKRRDHLISLGLASRKKKAAATPPAAPAAPAAPAGSSDPSAAA